MPPYIGNSPASVGNYQVVDDISSTFNGTLTSFALTVLTLPINPAKSGQLLVSINGVLQEPDDTGTEGFLVSGSNIVFSSAPATGSTFWAVWQGQAVDIGTPSDGTVGTAQMSSAELALTGGLSLGDNVKAKFGAGDDLQIYHDVNNSYIKDTGTGSLVLSADNNVNITNAAGAELKAQFITNGAVNLFYDNAKKLATTSTGIDVTGNVACDSLGVSGSTGNISLGGSGNNIDIGSSTGTQSAIINLGAGRTASGYAYIDLIGDTTYTDYGLRIMRENAGANAGSQISHRGTGNLAIAATDGGTLIFNSAGEKMRITSAGKVGIGTTGPARPLDVTDNTNDGTGGIVINSYLPTFELDDISAGGTSFILQQDGTNTIFKHDANERMRIDSSGNVGIGTSSPAAKLDVGGNIKCSAFTPDYTATVNAIWTTSTVIVPTGTLNAGYTYIVDFRIGTYSGTPYYLYGSTLITVTATNGTWDGNEVEIIAATHTGNGFSMYVKSYGLAYTTSGIKLRVTSAGATGGAIDCQVRAKRIF